MTEAQQIIDELETKQHELLLRISPARRACLCTLHVGSPPKTIIDDGERTFSEAQRRITWSSNSR
jgi:hypothetical protein